MYVDLLQIQRFSFLKFLRNGINQVFDNINPIIIANRKYIFFSKYYLLKIPSQIDFVSINNQFKPFEIMDSPKNPSTRWPCFATPDLPAGFNILSEVAQRRYTTPATQPVKNKSIIAPFKVPLKVSFQIKQCNKASVYTDALSSTWVKMRGRSMRTHGSAAVLKRNKAKLTDGSSYFKNWPPVAQQRIRQRENSNPLRDPLYAQRILKKVIDPSTISLMKADQNLNRSNLQPIQGISHLTYSSEFYIPVQIIDQISKKMYLRWLLLADLPIQTKRGHFIINGYPKTVIHQIVRSPGIRFKNEDHQILADIISMRGAWMGIQIVYEKNLKPSVVELTSGGTLEQNKDAARVFINNYMLPNNSFKNPNQAVNKNLTKTRVENTAKNTRTINDKNQNTNSNLSHYLTFPTMKTQRYRGTDLFLQQSRYPYQASFLQNAIIKSEKLNYLPSPTINLFDAKSENKALEKLKYYPSVEGSRNGFNDSPIKGREADLFSSGFPIKQDSKDLRSRGQVADLGFIPNHTSLLGVTRSPMKESEKIHEALSINFFISSSRTDKADKKKIKLSGFAFLNYLFDHPYFVYNNSIRSWQKSSFFPASEFLRVAQRESFDKLCAADKGSRSGLFYSRYAIPFKKGNGFKPPTISLMGADQKLWGFLKTRCVTPQTRASLYTDALFLSRTREKNNQKTVAEQVDFSSRAAGFYINQHIQNQQNYPLYFTTNDTLLKNLTWRFLKKIKHTRFSKIYPCLIENPSLLMYPLPISSNGSAFITKGFNLQTTTSRLNKEINTSSFTANTNPKDTLHHNPSLIKSREGQAAAEIISSKPREILREKLIHRFPYLLAPNQNGNLQILNHHDSLYNQFDNQGLPGNKTILTQASAADRLLSSLVSVLNTTNFRDVLFERFMNAKFYDIGLMGRKRLNKKLRLNIPLQCTTLTPLDFLAIFYKLFSLYKCDSLLYNLKIEF